MSEKSFADRLHKTVLSHSNIIISFIDNGAKIYTLAKEASAVKELAEFADTLQTCNSQQILNVFRGLPNECISMLSDEAQNQLKNPSYLTCLNNQQKENIICEIKHCQKKLVNSILFKEIACASAIILTQMKSLMKLSEELKETANLVEDSKEKIENIIKKLIELEKDQTKMSQKSAEMKETEKIDTAELGRLSLKLMVLIKKETEISSSIIQLKMKVDGKIISLNVQRTGAKHDVYVDAMQVLSNFIEFAMVGEMFSKTLIAVKTITTSLFVTLGVLKYQQCQLTAKRIKELSEILGQVMDLEQDVKTIEQILLDAETWINEQ